MVKLLVFAMFVLRISQSINVLAVEILCSMMLMYDQNANAMIVAPSFAIKFISHVTGMQRENRYILWQLFHPQISRQAFQLNR